MFRWILAMLLLQLAGCANFRLGAVTPQPAPVREVVEEKPAPAGAAAVAFLRYSDGVRRMSPVELSRELEQVRGAYLQEKSDWRRLQYGYLLLQAGHRQRDFLRAQAVLEPLLRDAKGIDPEFRSLASMLTSTAAEMQRQEEAGDALLQKLKDEQRRADTAESRAMQLQIKLDGLKSLEGSLYRRERMRH